MVKKSESVGGNVLTERGKEKEEEREASIVWGQGQS